MFLPGGVWATEPDGALPPLRFRTSDPSAIHAAYFDCPLAGLGLSPGWQRIVERGVALPAPAEILTATLGDGPLEWSALESLPQELAELRLETELACAAFTVVPVSMGDEPGTGGRVLAPLGQERWLFGSVGGRFFLVTRESATPIDTPTTTPHVAAFTDESGTVWLLGEGGRVATYRLDTGFVDRGTTASASGDGDTGDLAGSAATPPELFAVSRNGVIDRFDGSTWQVLIGDPVAEHDSPGVAFIAPEHAIAIGPRDGLAIVYDHGVVSEEALGEPDLNAITHVRSLGTIVGTVRGGYWLRTGSGWERLGDPEGMNVVRALAPFGGGFVAGTINGFVAQYHPQLGFCEAEQLAPNGIARIVPNGGGFVLAAIHELHMAEQPDVVTFVDASGAMQCGR